MGLAEEQEAWLEREGRTYALQGNCSIGRAPLNTVVLESPQVSRLHAILHSERGGAFYRCTYVLFIFLEAWQNAWATVGGMGPICGAR